MAREEESAVHPMDSHTVDMEQRSQTGLERVKALYSHPWTQIILISVICFCCPGVRLGRSTL